MPKQMSFVVNDEMEALIESLKHRFKVDSNAAVIRRALALAKVADENAGEDDTVTILDPKDRRRERVVMLAG